VSERPYKKWFTILNGLEAEFREAFPKRSDYKPQLHGRVPADIGNELAREIMAVRSTLRNLEKGEK